jgi:hypothetical protein
MAYKAIVVALHLCFFASFVGAVTLSITAPNGSVTDGGGSVWAGFALAASHWAQATDASFALWGGGNFAAYAWGHAPDYIAEYSCQAPFIAEKLLALGGPTERAVVAQWVLTLPITPAGKAWEASNTEWHVG